MIIPRRRQRPPPLVEVVEPLPTRPSDRGPLDEKLGLLRCPGILLAVVVAGVDRIEALPTSRSQLIEHPGRLPRNLAPLRHQERLSRKGMSRVMCSRAALTEADLAPHRGQRHGGNLTDVADVKLTRHSRESSPRPPSSSPTTMGSSRSARVRRQRRSMADGAVTGLTTTGYRLVLTITALSVAHHVDHIVRDVTGWPLGGGFNPFSASLFVYPVILAGVLLSRRQRVGARFWAILAGGLPSSSWPSTSGRWRGTRSLPYRISTARPSPPWPRSSCSPCSSLPWCGTAPTSSAGWRRSRVGDPCS